jgi:ElaB/YqjD/DUF883 family membrane-anchored ribosome-binding protein
MEEFRNSLNEALDSGAKAIESMVNIGIERLKNKLQAKLNEAFPIIEEKADNVVQMAKSAADSAEQAVQGQPKKTA